MAESHNAQAWKTQALVLLLFALWFPHSLERITRLGYDFPIYWNAGRGITGTGWLYAEVVRWAFIPFGFLPQSQAFAFWYALSCASWVVLVRCLPAPLVLVSVYPMLLALELGQITPVLAMLCLNPLGCVLAGCVKPYLFVLLAVHAFRFQLGAHTKRGRDLAENLLQGQSTFRFHGD